MSDARTQGFSKRVSLLAFKSNRMLTVMPIKERIDEYTGDVIPAHNAVMVFEPQRDAQGEIVRKDGNILVDRDKPVDWVSFGPSIGELSVGEIKAISGDLMVGTLAESGNYVLYKDNQQGLTTEVW